MIKSSAKKPVPKYVDTQSGHKNELIPSGLYPQVRLFFNDLKLMLISTRKNQTMEKCQPT